MSLLGKIIAALNVVAAIAFVLVAGLDWGQRQRWAYAVYRHDLLVEGLPIDDKELDPDQTPRVNKLAASTLKEIFAGNPVKTQAQEVANVRKLVQDKIDSPEVPGSRGQKLAYFLHPLARTYLERDSLAQLMASPEAAEKAAEGLQQQLQAHFDTVGERRPVEERKANAARLLFCLGEALEDPKADLIASGTYKRFVVVTGLAGAARAVDDQALLLQKMTAQAILAHEAERAQFISGHNQTVYESQTLADALDRQERFLKSKKDEADKQSLLVEARRKEIKDLTDKLEDERRKTGQKLDKQAELERTVMERLIDLRDTARKNQELERQIRELEGLPPER